MRNRNRITVATSNQRASGLKIRFDRARSSSITKQIVNWQVPHYIGTDIDTYRCLDCCTNNLDTRLTFTVSAPISTGKFKKEADCNRTKTITNAYDSFTGVRYSARRGH